MVDKQQWMMLPCCTAAAVQVNSSAVHRMHNSSARPLLSASAVGRHHKAHPCGSATGSATGDGSNIPGSSAATTDTTVDRSRTSSNSSSESSRHHLYDYQHPPAQVCSTGIFTGSVSMKRTSKGKEYRIH